MLKVRAFECLGGVGGIDSGPRFEISDLIVLVFCSGDLGELMRARRDSVAFNAYAS